MEHPFGQFVRCHLCRMLLELHFFHRDPMTSAPVNLMALIEKYSTDKHCREALMHLRFPDGVKCLKCKSENVAPVSDRKVYVCYSCKYQFSVTVGTIFHDSHLPLTKWFLVTYLMTESRKGISANQIKRMIGGSYKTSWYLCHRIRKAMEEADHKLTGTVEIDEMDISGKTDKKEQWTNKAPVVGIRERGGHLHFISASNLNQSKINDIIVRNVDKTVDVIMTDESKLYNFNLTKSQGKHKTVNHNGEDVRYEGGLCVTTNTIEPAFSLFKRGVVGAWQKVSVKHLPAYLREITFRFNNRKNNHLFRDTLIQMLQADNLEYRDLTGDKAA
jgi:transposase-like protein